jgi:hypothetical protein
MAVSDVDICNLALARIGGMSITALTEGTTNGELCGRFYSTVYDRVLRSYDWKCAIERQELSSGTTPSFGYDFAYILPADPFCLRVIQLERRDYEFTVEGRKLLTNETTAKIKYVSRAPTGNLDPLCVQVIYISLAIELAPSIAQDKKLTALLVEELNTVILPEATKANAIEALEPDYNRIKSGWLDARFE